jgi:hypothetical protein
MFAILAAALFVTPTVPSQVGITREASWNAYPRLVTEELGVPSGDMVRRVQLMLQREECQFDGQSHRRFNIDVNYAVMLDAQGNASQIIVEDVGCRPLENFVGQIASDIIRSGYVRVEPRERPTWFGNRINFNLQ